jgi:hypothetical protein
VSQRRQPRRRKPDPPSSNGHNPELEQLEQLAGEGLPPGPALSNSEGVLMVLGRLAAENAHLNASLQAVHAQLHRLLRAHAREDPDANPDQKEESPWRDPADVVSDEPPTDAS